MEAAVDMLSRGATNVNEGLSAAACGGHPTLIQLMIEHGATDWNGGLRSAATCNRHEIVALMIEHGADKPV
jgi:ankyrin repeat protein